MLDVNTRDVQQTEFERIRHYVEEHCGIVVGDEKSYLIESRLARLVAETGCGTFDEFYELLESRSAPDLRDKVIDAITTNETLWFRDRGPFECMRKKLLGDIVSRNQSGRYRVWSAGCSTGQEPYSVAMTIDRAARENPALKTSLSDFEILATDISPTVLYVAANGRYDSLAIKRGMDDYYLGKYFKQNGRIWVLEERIRKSVAFKKMNLQEPFAALGTFDLILCRNVLIYFSDLFRSRLYDKFAAALRPGGILMLGAAETPLGLTERFQRFANDDCVFYKPKET